MRYALAEGVTMEYAHGQDDAAPEVNAGNQIKVTTTLYTTTILCTPAVCLDNEDYVVEVPYTQQDITEKVNLLPFLNALLFPVLGSFLHISQSSSNYRDHPLESGRTLTTLGNGVQWAVI